MTLKKIFALIIIAVVAISFAACGFTPLAQNPLSTDSVIGNGGMSVQKGDYIYFVNGYETRTEIKPDMNKYGSVIKGAIYRTKLSDGMLPLDADENIDQIELVVPKIVGTESCGFYVLDELIVYTTPNSEKDKSGSLRSDLTDVCVIEINGASNKKVYTTTNANSAVKVDVKTINNKSYVIILDGGKLVSIEIENKSVKGTHTLAEDVTGATWSNQVNYKKPSSGSGPAVSDFDKTVFYTKASELTSATGNIVASVNLIDKSTKTLSNDNITAYSLLFAGEGALYYTKSSPYAGLYRNVLNTPLFANSETSLQLNVKSNYFIIPSVQGGFVGGFIYTDGDGTWFKKNGEELATFLSSDTHTVFAYKGNIAYTRATSSMIYAIDLSASTIAPKEILASTVNAKTNGKEFMDIDNGKYIFYFAEHTNANGTSYYTHIVDLESYNVVDGYADKMIGKFTDTDKPDEEEDEEDDGHDH